MDCAPISGINLICNHRCVVHSPVTITAAAKDTYRAAARGARQFAATARDALRPPATGQVTKLCLMTCVATAGLGSLMTFSLYWPVACVGLALVVGTAGFACCLPEARKVRAP